MNPAKLPCKMADVVKKVSSATEKGSREVTQMRLTSLFIFFSVIIKGRASCVTECGKSFGRLWETFGDHCYFWANSRPEEVSWNRAAQRCRDGLLRNSNLASVTSDAIHQYVLEGMKKRGLDFVWLGGTDKVKEGTWSWIDGSPFEFTNWSRGEPNNWKIEIYEPDEDCMHMDRLGRLGQDRGKWNDLRCDTKLHFLCAKKICQT